MSSQELSLPSSQQPDLKSDVPSSDAPIPTSPSPAKQQDSAVAQNASIRSHGTEIADTMMHENDPQSSLPPPAAPTNPRLAVLQTKHSALQLQLSELEAQRARYISHARLPSGLAMPSDWSEEQKHKQALATANAIIKEHIALLHGYNEIKDIGQGLMGIVAEKRQVRIKEVMEDFGMGERD